jgi:hypothetical protein
VELLQPGAGGEFTVEATFTPLDGVPLEPSALAVLEGASGELEVLVTEQGSGALFVFALESDNGAKPANSEPAELPETTGPEGAPPPEIPATPSEPGSPFAVNLPTPTPSAPAAQFTAPPAGGLLLPPVVTLFAEGAAFEQGTFEGAGEGTQLTIGAPGESVGSVAGNNNGNDGEAEAAFVSATPSDAPGAFDPDPAERLRELDFYQETDPEKAVPKDVGPEQGTAAPLSPVVAMPRVEALPFWPAVSTGGGDAEIGPDAWGVLEWVSAQRTPGRASQSEDQEAPGRAGPREATRDERCGWRPVLRSQSGAFLEQDAVQEQGANAPRSPRMAGTVVDLGGEQAVTPADTAFGQADFGWALGRACLGALAACSVLWNQPNGGEGRTARRPGEEKDEETHPLP